MAELTNEQILSNLYYDLESGYGSVKSLYEQAKEKRAGVSLEEVKAFMKKQPNKQIKPYQSYNSFLVPYSRAEFQIEQIAKRILCTLVCLRSGTRIRSVRRETCCKDLLLSLSGASNMLGDATS